MKDRSVFAFKVIQYCFHEFSADLLSPSGVTIISPAIPVAVDNERFLLLMKDMMEELLQTIDRSRGQDFRYFSSIILVLGEILSIIPLLVRSSSPSSNSIISLSSRKIIKRSFYLYDRLSSSVESCLRMTAVKSSSTFFQHLATMLQPLIIGEEQLSTRQKEMSISSQNPVVASLGEFNCSLSVLANQDQLLIANLNKELLEDNFLEEIEDDDDVDEDNTAVRKEGENKYNHTRSVFTKEDFDKIHQRLLYLFSLSSTQDDISTSLSLQRSIVSSLGSLSSQYFVLFSLSSFRPLVYSAVKCLVEKIKEFHALFRMKIFSQYFFYSNTNSSSLMKEMRDVQRLEFEEEDKLKVKLLLHRDQQVASQELSSRSSLVSSSNLLQESIINNSSVPAVERLFLRLSLLPDIYSFFSLCLVIDTSFLSYQLCENLLPEIMKSLIIFMKLFVYLPSSSTSSKSTDQESTRNSLMSRFYLQEQLKLSLLTFLLSCLRQKVEFAKIFTSFDDKYDIVKSLLFYLLIFFCDNEVRATMSLFSFLSFFRFSLFSFLSFYVSSMSKLRL
jgi:hypothetical protein